MSETDLKQAAAEQTGDFNPEQKRYLEGFVAGVQIAKAAKSVSGSAAAGRAAPAPEPVGPDAAGLKAQSRLLASGGKLSDQEKCKREEHPFDAYERLKEHAAKGAYPKPDDNFRWRYFGLFYVAPNQNSLHVPPAHSQRHPQSIAQFAGLADLAERYGGGYAHVTTRANLQIREIEPHNAVACSRRCRTSACARAAPAPTISATSPARRPPASIRRSLSTRAPCARMALPHPQRPLALRPAAQVQRRLRRRRHHSDAGGHQRHRLSRRCRSATGSASSPASGSLVPRRHHRPSRFRPRHRRALQAEGLPARSPTRSCASSSSTATAPTAPRRG